MRREPSSPKAVQGNPPAGKISDGHASYLRVRMLGLNKDMEIAPEDARTVRANHLIGNDPHERHTNIPTCKAVLYGNACPEIEFKFYGDNCCLEYDFIVNSGAAPSKVKLQPSGARDVLLVKSGKSSGNAEMIELCTEKLFCAKSGPQVRFGRLAVKLAQYPGSFFSIDQEERKHAF